jgi:hypothetical protein
MMNLVNRFKNSRIGLWLGLGGAVLLVEFLGQVGDVWGGHNCGAYGLVNSRQMEDAHEAIEVPE